MAFYLSFQIRARPEAKVGWTHQTAEEEKDYSSCDLEVMSQSLILPPTDRPYFLLLQGYDQSKVPHAALIVYVFQAVVVIIVVV